MKRTEERWKWRWNKGEKRNKLEGEETGKEYMIGVGKKGRVASGMEGSQHM